MNTDKHGWLLYVLMFPLAVQAQFVSVSGGGTVSQSKSQAGNRAAFSNSVILAADAGMPVLPFVTAGLHYGYSHPELALVRGDAFGSRATADLTANTLTFEAHARTPEIGGWRAYGLAGVGFTRFGLDVKQRLEVPFPGGAPNSVTSPVLTYGGGVERKLAPLVRAKFEVRDYLTGLPRQFFSPGGTFHRPTFLGGIVLGR